MIRVDYRVSLSFGFTTYIWVIFHIISLWSIICNISTWISIFLDLHMHIINSDLTSSKYIPQLSSLYASRRVLLSVLDSALIWEYIIRAFCCDYTLYEACEQIIILIQVPIRFWWWVFTTFVFFLPMTCAEHSFVQFHSIHVRMDFIDDPSSL